MLCTAVIIGRPNVGKSTLFNRLIGGRGALVDNTPGLTRDWQEGLGAIGDIELRVVDTAGLEDSVRGSLADNIRRNTEKVLATADVVLLLFDSRVGVTPFDHHCSKWVKQSGKPVILVANKCESSVAEAGILDSYSLGLGEPVPISAEHGEGLAQLYSALTNLAHKFENSPPNYRANPLSIAILGRPNAGKSTLANRLIGEERLLTSPEPGTTRDSIAVDWMYGDRKIRLVDTAGLRRRSRVVNRLERLAVADALRSIRLAELVILVLDGTRSFERQDQTIARKIAKEGRALVITLNKCDVIKEIESLKNQIQLHLGRSLPQIRGVPLVPISARRGKGIHELMETVVNTHNLWSKRISTGPLNRWLDDIVSAHPPPAIAGRRPQLRYITQTEACPPTFKLFAGRADGIPDSYVRYLTNALRDGFELEGIPIRISLQTSRNPYAKK